MIHGILTRSCVATAIDNKPQSEPPVCLWHVTSQTSLKIRKDFSTLHKFVHQELYNTES